MKLNPLQRDALLEAFNIALGHAAVGLSQLLRETIALTAPRLELLTADAAVGRIRSLVEERIAAVALRFEGELAAHALLLIPQSRALELVRLAVGGLAGDEDLSELEEEAISEIGNIVLNACMAVLGAQLHLQMRTAPPDFVLDVPEHLFGESGAAEACAVLMVDMVMTVVNHNLATYIAFLLDARSHAALVAALEGYLAGVGLAGESAETGGTGGAGGWA